MSTDIAPTHDDGDTGVEQPWELGNDEWWAWYMSLAANGGGGGELVTVEAPAPVPLPDAAALTQELADPYGLTGQQIAQFADWGYVKLPAVLSPGAIALARRELEHMMEAAHGGDVAGRFVSLELMWLENPILRSFVLSPRLGRIAADLLGVAAVRLYHDHALSKEPGCGRTPWHYDFDHYPMEGQNTVTSWIPLQDTPREMGPLAFARGMEAYRKVEHIPHSAVDDSYDRGVSEVFRDQGVVVEDDPFARGDVSFHHTLNFHTAGANRTTAPRMVLSDTYFEDGARLIDSPSRFSGDWQKFMPGAQAGEPIATELNPIVSG